MPSYSPAGLTDIANLSLQMIGSQPIDSIDDANLPRARQCANTIWRAVEQVGRRHNWNCLSKRKRLTQITLPESSSCYGQGTSIGWKGCRPSSPPPYWLAGTVYTGGTLVTWGQAIYYCLQGYTSSAWFINDETAGYWAQIYSSFFGDGEGNADGYEWNYAYMVPPDFLLIDELNGTDCRKGRGVGDLYELFVVQQDNSDASVSNARVLFCNEPYANVKYTALIQDPTIYDPLFIDCVAVVLASKIATPILGDDGKRAQSLLETYESITLPNAMLKDAGEKKDRPYDPTRESKFLKSRYGSTAG